MRCPYVLVVFLIPCLLLLTLQLALCNECYVRDIDLSASVPAAVKPGDRINFYAHVSGGCECGGECEVYLSCYNGDRTYTSDNKWNKRGYCTVRDVPGGEFYVSATGECRGPSCGPGDQPGSASRGPVRSSVAYIVSVPSSFSLSANPTTLPKQGSVNVRVTGLSSIDDGKGTLSVVANFGGRSYTLRRTSQGTFEETINYDLRNTPAGQQSIGVTVAKSYSGVSNSESKSVTVTLQGSRPSIDANIPSQVRRGDSVSVTISEPDGDDVKARLRVADRTFDLSKGNNKVSLDVPKGDYTLAVEASDVDGSDSKSYSIKILGSPPSLRINVANELRRGDSFTVVVVEEDGDDVSGSLTFGGRSFRLDKGENDIAVPVDLRAGSYTIHATVMDPDGESKAEASFELINQEPKLSLNVDKSDVLVGETVRILVEASDDAPGLTVRTQVGEVTFDGTGAFEYTPGSAGNVEVRSVATDMDGISVEATLRISVKEISSEDSGGSGSSSRDLGGSGTSNSTSGGSEEPRGSGGSGSSSGGSGSYIDSLEDSGGSTAMTSSMTTVPVIEVVPLKPYVGDEVTVRVITRFKGLLQVIDPQKSVIVDTAMLQARLKVDKPGLWLAKFTYKEGDKVKVVTKSFIVSPLTEAEQNSQEGEKASLSQTETESFERIESFEPNCLVIVGSESGSLSIPPWVYLAVTFLALILIFRRRVVG
ncbi:MAG: hypothetical protein NZ992_00620 [Candidatus Korarchaeum sp.]|nr:hypothetical protein [Candidatus Korarchaeum sp.]MDW8035229.1 hypothetical protein [Candidatus Korarchaeum sp.]